MRVLYISEVQWLSQVSRKHQLVRRFPSDWDVLFLSPMNASAGENSLRERVDPTSGNVRYASLLLPKPDSGFAPVRALTGLLSRTGMRAIASRVRAFKPDVVVCSYIWAAPLVPRLAEMGIPVVYDCNDLHTEFYPACPDKAFRAFRNLIVGATEVVVSSGYLRRACGRGRFVGNGVDLDTFTGRRDCPLPGPIAGSRLADCEQFIAYVGSVDDRIDFDVLEAVAVVASRQETRTGLMCVGRVFSGARDHAEALVADHADHVLFTGRAPYEELPAYLSHAAVGIAPFVLNARTRAINPNKLYMYAAMEQNIVSTPFSVEIGTHEDLIFIAEGADEFAARTMEALGDEERRRAVRDRLAVPNSWDEKSREFQNILSQVLSGGRREA
jgi:glycosyltransferase involved in cell wall biosynthesis